MTTVAIAGIAGRMGRSIMSVQGEFHDIHISQGVVGSTPFHGVDTVDDASKLQPVDVIIDFATPRGFSAALAAAVRDGSGFVSGSTGLSDEQIDELAEASTSIPVLLAANFSVGVNILEHLVESAARAAQGFDIEVFEAHHRNKVDAPSGTALFLGEAAARGREAKLNDVAQWARQGHTGARSDEEIGFQVVRGGSVVGEHTVFLLGAGERIELTHRAQDRAIFARGALRAASWIAGKAPGNYTMRDVLFT